MTDNIFGDDFDLDPNFDKSHLPDNNKDENVSEKTKPLDSFNNTANGELDDANKQSDADLFDGLDWSDEPATNNGENTHTPDNKSHIPTPELNNILDEYGIETEVKNVNVDDRIIKMQQRAENKKPTSKSTATKKSPFATILWLIGCLILLGLIVVQYSIFNINTLIKHPEHRIRLAQVCDTMSCQLPNADIDSIQITHIKHRPSQVKTATNNIDIMAAIVNGSEKTQLYPNLKVTIYGTTGKIGEFVASPDDYMKIKQTQLFSGQARLVMFTLSMKNRDIKDIEIKSFY